MFDLTPYERKNRMRAYDPFRELEEFEKKFWSGHLTEDFKTDIKDAGDHFELEADLPGFKKEDINVDVNDGYLTIRAERHSEAEEKDKKGRYIRCERSYGSFSRSFDLNGIQTDAITAAYKDGVLTLKLPKETKTLPASRRLEIE